MLYSKIVLAGGNGYLGRVLVDFFKTKSSEVVVLSRRSIVESKNVRSVIWDGKSEGEWVKYMDDADLLVNLCGKNVNCRYTEANKKEIIDSRVRPTALLGRVINCMERPPKIWINIASATIYRHAEDHAQDEISGEIGYGFSIDVCRQWEESFFNTTTPQTKKIALRMGIVLGKQDGVFPRLLNLVRFGMGGKQGNGQQMISWIHEQDVARCIEWFIKHPVEGIVNCTAPGPVTNTELMRMLRRSYGISFGLPMPVWMLELGAVAIGTEPELILKSRWVHPKRLLDEGFTFMFPEASAAVNDILSVSS